VETKTISKTKGLNLIHLSSFAQYLLTHKLEMFVEQFMQETVETDLPLLRRVSEIPADKKRAVAVQLITDLLTRLADNNAPEQIQTILFNWQRNELPFLDKYEITPEDITKLSYILKKTFLHFLPEYCVESSQMLQVVKEIDSLLMQYDLAASETYMRLLQSKIDDNSHLINKVSNTLPGAMQKLIEKLQESEKLYKQAQSMAHIGNWTVNLDTNAVSWSDEMYNIYGLNEGDQPAVEKLFAMVHPDDYERVLEAFELCRKNRSSLNMVHKIVAGDGSIKTLHQKAEFITSEEGSSLLMVGSTQDVTDQYQIQQELEEKQNFIRKIADATPSVITSYNINTGKYVFVSEGLKKLLGYDPEEAIIGGVDFFTSIIHPDDLPAIVEKNKKALDEANQGALKKESIVEFIYRIRNKNGNYCWFHTYGTVFDRNSNGKVEHVLNISLDVTKSVEATKKIEEQEYFIQRIADASPTILYLFDVTRNSFVYLNREIFYVLGYTPEEVLAFGEDAVNRLYHPDDKHLLPERKGSGAKFEHKESMMQYECRLQNKAGEWSWFLVREIVFGKNKEGDVQQVLGAALDINKRKEMEKTLLQNSFRLEQSNSSLEEFAYVASHDLKEPLRKISTFGDRMAATQLEKLTDDGKIYLKKIVDASQRMQLMIDDLLSVSMISGNRSFENYSLQSILEDARQAVEFKIEQKGAVINSTALPEANIIPSQFRQLFQNLLSNSLKFVREGVPPVIKISHKFLNPADIPHLQLPKASGYLQLEFEDNGIGFENEFAGKIFQIFHRLHGRSEYEGTGIGLAICKKIVEHHGGLIFASGKAGEGAKFTIILPR
jgi:PAS domain S-box-containing protein